MYTQKNSPAVDSHDLFHWVLAVIGVCSSSWLVSDTVQNLITDNIKLALLLTGFVQAGLLLTWYSLVTHGFSARLRLWMMWALFLVTAWYANAVSIVEFQLPGLRQVHEQNEAVRLWQSVAAETARIRTQTAQQLRVCQQELRAALTRENLRRRQAMHNGEPYAETTLRNLEDHEQTLSLVEQKLSAMAKLEPTPPADPIKGLARVALHEEKYELLYEGLPDYIRSEVAVPRWPRPAIFPDDAQNAFVTGLRAGRFSYVTIALLAGVLNWLPLLALLGLFGKPTSEPGFRQQLSRAVRRPASLPHFGSSQHVTTKEGGTTPATARLRQMG
jgi:hypothetical protein